MKKILVLFILLILTQKIIAQQPEKKYESIWEGVLKINSLELRLVFKLYQKEGNTYGADLDSPDQGVSNIPVTNVSITYDSVKAEVKSIGASFGGKILSQDLVEGTFKQGGASLPLQLKKVDKVAEVKRPQTPQKPYAYNEEEITFENKSANITLAGTLTFPKGEKKYPAVVLVSGSGPQDRNETLMGHKPFLVIADYLTRNGIAVLRFDDRGVAKSKGNFATATSEDFATDALAAVEYLKTRKEIDVKKIGIAGHSEGGLIAPMCAVNSNDVGFVVLLAGPGVSGKEIILLQGKLISQAMGEVDKYIDKGVLLSEKIFELVNDEPDNLAVEKKAKILYDEYYSTLSDDEKKKEDAQKATMDQRLKQLTSPWFRFFLKFDPRPTLENVTVPVLALNGSKDLQVDAKQNLPEIEKALKSGGNKNYKIVELENLNHLFQPTKTGAPAEYGKIETTFSEEAMKIMKDWILEVTK